MKFEDLLPGKKFTHKNVKHLTYVKVIPDKNCYHPMANSICLNPTDKDDDRQFFHEKTEVIPVE